MIQEPHTKDRELNLLHLLQRVWTYAITTKSDRSREYADELAEASSRGFVTTLVAMPAAGCEPVYGRLWKLTEAGLNHLTRYGYRIANQETQEYVEEHAHA